MYIYIYICIYIYIYNKHTYINIYLYITHAHAHHTPEKLLETRKRAHAMRRSNRQQVHLIRDNPQVLRRSMERHYITVRKNNVEL